MKNLIVLSSIALSLPAFAAPTFNVKPSSLAEIAARYRALSEKPCAEALADIVSINFTSGLLVGSLNVQSEIEKAQPNPNSDRIEDIVHAVVEIKDLVDSQNALFAQACTRADQKIGISNEQGQQVEAGCSDVEKLLNKEQMETGVAVGKVVAENAVKKIDVSKDEAFTKGFNEAIEVLSVRAATWATSCVNAEAKVTLPEIKAQH